MASNSTIAQRGLAQGSGLACGSSVGIGIGSTISAMPGSAETTRLKNSSHSHTKVKDRKLGRFSSEARMSLFVGRFLGRKSPWPVAWSKLAFPLRFLQTSQPWLHFTSRWPPWSLTPRRLADQTRSDSNRGRGSRIIVHLDLHVLKIRHRKFIWNYKSLVTFWHRYIFISWINQAALLLDFITFQLRQFCAS